jgi:hypothetical protein
MSIDDWIADCRLPIVDWEIPIVNPQLSIPIVNPQSSIESPIANPNRQ